MRVEKDNIDKMFESLEGTFDIHEPSENHTAKFARMLNQKAAPAKKTSFKKWWYIAASVVVLVATSVSVLVFGPEQHEDIAEVAPELYQSQTYFTGIINQELEKLKKEDSPETRKIVEDAVVQINKLEKDYETLKKHLLENGADKRIIYAMITNLQSRIELLKHVLETIDNVKTINTETHEIIT